MNKVDIITPYKGISKFYFEKIIDEIIKLGNLKSEKKILDYGCGSKFLEKKLGKKIYNYDLDPRYTELNKWNLYNFDIIILNHVLMYMDKEEFKKIITEIKKINPKCEVIIGLGKETILNKIAAFAALKFDYLKNTKLNYFEQIELIKDELKVFIKKDIYFLSEIYLCRL